MTDVQPLALSRALDAEPAQPRLRALDRLRSVSESWKLHKAGVPERPLGSLARLLRYESKPRWTDGYRHR